MRERGLARWQPRGNEKFVTILSRPNQTGNEFITEMSLFCELRSNRELTPRAVERRRWTSIGDAQGLKNERRFAVAGAVLPSPPELSDQAWSVRSLQSKWCISINPIFQ